jgi:hypothetical protein
LRAVEEATTSALRHRALVGAADPRRERVEMALRAARWLSVSVQVDGSVADLAAWCADDGAWIDIARRRLQDADPLPSLGDAWQQLARRVADRLHDVEAAFAKRLAAEAATMPSAGRAVPVEHVLDRVVAPLAASGGVLLLVMDGLSLGVFRELFVRSDEHRWFEQVPKDLGAPLHGLAAFPTVTETSRASLLCGRLVRGAAAAERTGFAKHGALAAVSVAGRPPRLFHKGELLDGAQISAGVRAALSDRRQRVVGVVYNAVDDQLSGADQLTPRWSIHDLKGLAALLEQARMDERVLIVTADHGHVIDHGTEAVAAAGAVDDVRPDRWRPGRDARAPHEVAITGPRVIVASGRNEVVALWGERTRYGQRRAGYHGGVSLHEVVVPLSVFAPHGRALDGWMPRPVAGPEWWWATPTPTLAAAPATTATRPSASTAPSARSSGQASLFVRDPADDAVPPAATVGPTPDRIGALFTSRLYVAQRQLAGRVALPDARMRDLLEALLARGGKLSKDVLAQRLGIPLFSIAGTLSAARRVLNADQAAVLTVDDASGTVELNLALLQQQFADAATSGGDT